MQCFFREFRVFPRRVSVGWQRRLSRQSKRSRDASAAKARFAILQLEGTREASQGHPGALHPFQTGSAPETSAAGLGR